MTPTSALVSDLLALGVTPGGLLLVHSAYRALRPVEDGPDGVVAALLAALGPSGTLVMPSWTSDDDTPFDPATTPADPDLGAVAEAFRHWPGVVRSAHPFAFAAIGPLAEAVVATPLPLPPHGPGSPVARLHEHDGAILLLGTGHDSDTVLHFAETLAGVPYGLPKHVTVVEAGRRKQLEYRENDHCCARFALADDWLRPAGLQAEGPVGSAWGRLFRARDAVAAATTALAADPLLFLHPPAAGCADCDAARASIGARY